MTSAVSSDSHREPDAAEQAAPPTVAEYEDRWRRCMADVDNLRKRYTRELAREREQEHARATAAWLPLLDNLERALAHGMAHPNSLLEGVAAVREQALGVLEQLGYPRDDEEGIPFDPARHDVVEVVEAPDVDPDTVVRVLRPGYGRDLRQLRPAAVAVSKRE
ncbi:MAG: grpE 1 [Frankiales bacterium]|nr:grpE 1 [Frankiales bacterium]